ncbi:MAG: hypothetical protein IJO20_03870 [Ruminococcus sp.]|nr:hypothetical protein [Ruminococcus sp.]
MGQTEIKVYHGTDQGVVDNILRSGFRCKPNKEHWLGEGIYFYTDRSLAEWWTTNPTKKHGIEITNPAIIECTIKVDDDRILNLCTLTHYEKYVDIYNSFFRQWAYQSQPDAEVNFKQLRCAFFDYLHMLFKVDVIVAPFILPDQPYIPPCHNERYANNMHIMYAEIQVCVRESAQELIKEKVVHILKGGN